MKIGKTMLVAASLLAVGGLQANADFRFGVKAGLNVDKLKLSNKGLSSLESDNHCGWTAGVTTDFTVPVIGIGFDASVMYTRMNSRTEGMEWEGENKGRNFLEIPVNLKYKLSIPAISNIIAPYIYTGPTLALKLGSDDNFLKTKTCQWGWNLGLGVQLINHLQIGAGYTWGMNNIMKHVNVPIVGDYTPTSLKVKNNYWTVTAAYLF
ncbi:MAG: porin family protein [Muribaculaceae bacterium]|nr:porin family protein [Muribaculaceae bacterium]